MRQVEYERAAERYERGRGMSLAAIAPWRDALEPWLGSAAHRRTVLDVGAGTGQFVDALRGWFGCDVVALEPAAAMRREGSSRPEEPSEPGRLHGAARWIGGRVDHLPLAPGACQAAWLSTVLHHLGDLHDCASELRRVLTPGSPVLIRSAFPERADGITLLRYFPEARRRIERFPTVEQVGRAFAVAGFAVCGVREVAQVSAADLADYRARIVAGRHADTLLTAIDDAAFARGLASLDADVASAPRGEPVRDLLTLLVLR